MHLLQLVLLEFLEKTEVKHLLHHLGFKANVVDWIKIKACCCRRFVIFTTRDGAQM